MKKCSKKKIKIMPTITTTIEDNYFIGNLYKPKQDRFPGKVIIVVGGGDGSYQLTKMGAQEMARHGMTTFALAYWNLEGLPDTVSRIPLEYVENAAKWLKEKGYKKIGMWGISKGAEYTLLCASYLNDLISCAIAVSPVNACVQGFQMISKKYKSIKILPHSTFMFRGKELPYAKVFADNKKLFRDSLKYRSVTLRSQYNGIVENAPENTRIPVENMKGPLLLLAADIDNMWYSKDACEAIVKRLEEKNFSYPVEFYHYYYASHILIPFRVKCRNLFWMERRYPKECRKSNIDAFKKTLKFLKQW